MTGRTKAGNWMYTAASHCQMEGTIWSTDSGSDSHRSSTSFLALFSARTDNTLEIFFLLLVYGGMEFMGRSSDVFSSLLAQARGERWLHSSLFRGNPKVSEGEKFFYGTKLWAVHLVVYLICKGRRHHLWVYTHSWAMLQGFSRGQLSGKNNIGKVVASRSEERGG